MKNKKLIYLLSGIIATVVILFFLRHQIIKHALTVSINKKTNETINLKIGDLYYDILNSNVSFTNSNFLFNNTYLNEEKTIEISNLSFQRIEIEGLSIFRLLFKRELVAKSIITQRPSISFLENNNPIKFKEKRSEIVHSFKTPHNFLHNFVLIVDKFEISKGLLDLKSVINDSNKGGMVGFTIILDNINTSKDHIFKGDKLLYAENHFVSLDNFEFYLSNGNSFNFDTIKFQSENNSFLAKNIQLKIADTTTNSRFTNIIVDVANISGTGVSIDSIYSNKKIEVSNISLSDANISIVKNENYIYKPTIDSTHNIAAKIFSKVNSLVMNILDINNVNFILSDNTGDTIVSATDFGCSIADIKFDSSFITSNIPKLDYKSIVVNLKNAVVNDSKSGLHAIVNQLDFNENNKLLSTQNILINDSNTLQQSSFNANVKGVDIGGISVKSIINDLPMDIAITIHSPDLKLDMAKLRDRESASTNLTLGKSKITNLIIDNGKLRLWEENKFKVITEGINFNSGKINLADLRKIKSIDFSHVNLSTSTVKLNLVKDATIIDISSVSLKNNDLYINNISTYAKYKDKIDASVDVRKLLLTKINFYDILNKKEVNVESINIYKPKLIGSIFLGDSIKNSNDKIHKQQSDYKFIIGSFNLSKANIDLDFHIKNEVLQIKSNLDVKFSNLDFINFKDSSWIHNLRWDANLTHPEIAYRDYKIKCSDIASNNLNELLLLKDIRIFDTLTSTLKSGVDIQKLTIGNINLSGIVYPTIFNKQKPIINNLEINKVYFDIKINASKNKHSNFNMPADIKNININNLSCKVEKHDSISTSDFSVGKLDLNFNLVPNANIINEILKFNVSDFNYSDTLKNSYASLKSVIFDNNTNSLKFASIEGGSIKKQLKINDFLHFSTNQFDINNIAINNVSPHNLYVDSIYFNNFNLITESQDNSAKHHKTLKLFLPSSVNSINVNKIKCNNLSVTTTHANDSTIKTHKITNVSINLNKIVIDSNALASDDYAFADNISVDLSKNSIITKDSLYAISTKGFVYKFKENKLIIDSVLVKPRYKSMEFFKKAVYQIGMMDVELSKIVCSNIRFNEIIKHNIAHVGSIDTYGLKMYIFKNKKYEINPTQYKPMPQEALFKLKQIIVIDSLFTHNSYINYKQLSKKSLVPGEIFLDSVNLSVYNINNNLNSIDKTSVMKATFNGMLVGESAINLKMTMPLMSSSNNFWISGHIDKVDFKKLNPITENLVGITFKSGKGEVDIPLISGNNNHSSGTILFKYKKLKIELYNRDKARNAQGLGGNMANLLLNNVFIKSNNPRFFGKTKSGEVYYKRNTQKAIVNYIWKSVFSGLMSTMGYNNKEQRQETKSRRRSRR